MGVTCSKQGCKKLVGEPEGKRPLGRLRCNLEVQDVDRQGSFIWGLENSKQVMRDWTEIRFRGKYL
jgi:hypothetical protein